jgi:hypothetical protein
MIRLASTPPDGGDRELKVNWRKATDPCGVVVLVPTVVPSPFI